MAETDAKAKDREARERRFYLATRIKELQKELATLKAEFAKLDKQK
jgi:hypothetical protein